MNSTSVQGKEYDYIFKVILLGNSNVGKSSLFLRFVDDVWNDTFVPTIGVDFKIKTFDVDDKKVKMQIWDTAGQDRFKNIIASYYRGAHGILLIYDITDKDSFKNLSNWLIEIEKNANKNVLKLLIGNKNDLEEKRAIQFSKGKEFADSFGMKFIETSAKLNSNVLEAFQLIAKELITVNADHKAVNTKQNKTIKVSPAQELGFEVKKEKKGGCCG